MLMFGMQLKYDRSKMPWWVSPSLPTSPARSNAKTTERFWMQTSWSTWSNPLCRKEESHRYHRFYPAAAMPAAEDHCMLFRNSHIKEAVRVAFGKCL